MKRQKKVGLMIPHLQSGGAERVVTITSKLLNEAGFEVYIFLFDQKNISYSFEGSMINLNSKAWKFKGFKVLSRISRIMKLSYYLWKYKIDINISFLYAANVVNYFSFFTKKIVLTCRGQRDYILNGDKYSKMMKKTSQFIVQTERMKLDFIKDFKVDESKLVVLPNPFDVDYIKRLALEPLSENDFEFIEFRKNHITAVTMGAFKKDKGYWHLIKSFILARKQNPELGLVFIGHRGELEENIKNMVKKYNLEKHIFFVGFQVNPYKFLDKCDFYVCSSLNEGFPNAIVEAMGLGLPVISTDCKNGPREILENTELSIENTLNTKKYGILVEPFDLKSPNYEIEKINKEEEKFAEKMIELSLSKNLREYYGELSYNRSLTYDYDTYIKKLVGLVIK